MSESYKYVNFGADAADAVLNKGAEVNETIAKIAETEELNPEEIQRVVESTNHILNSYFRKHADDKSYTFPLAKKDAVMEKLSKKQYKNAAAISDAAMFSLMMWEPNEQTDPINTKLGMDEIYHLPTELSEAKTYLQDQITKIAYMEEEAQYKTAQAIDAFVDSLNEFVKEAVDTLYFEDIDLDSIMKVAEKNMSNYMERDLVTKLKKKLKDEIKIETGKVDPKLLDKKVSTDYSGRKSANPDIVIVNGKHKLYSSIARIIDNAVASEKWDNVAGTMHKAKNVVMNEFKKLENNPKDIEEYLRKNVKNTGDELYAVLSKLLHNGDKRFKITKVGQEGFDENNKIKLAFLGALFGAAKGGAKAVVSGGKKGLFDKAMDFATKAPKTDSNIVGGAGTAAGNVLTDAAKTSFTPQKSTESNILS